MADRPGAQLATRPLHFFILADCSGSMAADGKMHALNNALRETVPHLVDIAEGNPHADLLIRVVRFATGATWHVEEPTPAAEFAWPDMEAEGYTDLGAALDLVASQLEVPPMEARALPPAIVLISDGMPTDDWEDALERLLLLPWGERSVRTAVAIGRDAARDVLMEFVSDKEVGPVSANNPEQLVRLIRWASTQVGKAASLTANETTAQRSGPVPFAEDDEAVIW
ncbi:MAG: hypothetical protein R8F63_17290 [Acidimicrobiales bacterium]|nr:hypothetical protein [Acidimicrobiales bacterium]